MKGFSTVIILTILLFTISFSTTKAQSNIEDEFQMLQ
jgi:hypothetical protein